MSLTIRARLTAWYTAVVVVVLVAEAAAVTAVQHRLSLDRVDGELQRLFLTLEGVMRTELNEGLTLQASADEASAEVVAPDRSLVLTQADGTPLAAWGLALPQRWSTTPANDGIPYDVTLGGAGWRALHREVEYRGHRYVGAVLTPLADLQRERAILLWALAAGVALALGLAAVGGWVVARQSLQPLGEMADQAAIITERDPAIRLQPRHEGDELGRLAAAFNALLDRLADALHAQRQFMADASHELRTPVSVVQTTAQVTLRAERRAEAEYRESLTIVAEQSGRLARLVDAMFLLSRAEARGIPLSREPLYMDDLVTESARALRVFADERDVRVNVESESEMAFSGDDTLLRQMVGNLLHNAIRHAVPGGKVTASVGRTAGSIVLRVMDDGAGVPAGEHERIFQRFARADKSPGGAGLGLPIARWIAEAHGGRLELECTGPDGSCFTVTLPDGRH
jgi:two-component system OmpR family sensor kinase